MSKIPCKCPHKIEKGKPVCHPRCYLKHEKLQPCAVSSVGVQQCCHSADVPGRCQRVNQRFNGQPCMPRLGSLFQAEIVAKQKLWIDVRFFEMFGELCLNFIAFLKTWNILVGGFNPFEKICSSICIISPNKRENKKSLPQFNLVIKYCWFVDGSEIPQSIPTCMGWCYLQKNRTVKSTSEVEFSLAAWSPRISTSKCNLKWSWLRPSWSWRLVLE